MQKYERKTNVTTTQVGKFIPSKPKLSKNVKNVKYVQIPK